MYEFGRRAFLCEVTRTPLDFGAGTLAIRGNRFQALEPGRISALSMQHQALVARRQPPRDRSADPGSAAGDD